MKKNWRSTHTQAPRIQNGGRFRRSNIVQTSRPRGQRLCLKFAKIPHVGCARTFKVPTLSRGPPPPPSGITFKLSFLSMSVMRQIWKARRQFIVMYDFRLE